MKMYETKYVFSNGWSQTNRRSIPELPENIIGDLIDVTLCKDGEIIIESCEIVEIRQSVINIGEECVIFDLSK